MTHLQKGIICSTQAQAFCRHHGHIVQEMNSGLQFITIN